MSPASLAWIPRFLKHLSIERRLSAHTDSSYRRDLERFVAWCDHDLIPDWRALDGQHIRTFAAAEFRRGVSPRTIARRLSALRSFFQFLIREGELRANPANEIKAPKASKRLPETIDVDQMTRLLSFRTDERLGVRDKAIMELFYSSGLRLAELVGLDLTDVDLADRTVRVLGKGAKTRIVPVGRHAADAI
ncbi:MAG: tyrosine recombinase XerC, partial [Lysobacterales bacterium]